MTSEFESARARRYLLGESSEEESAAIERQYFRSEDAVDAIAAAEDELIDDYLGDRLDPRERALFERGYLASPQHRRRVEVIRGLGRGARALPTRRGRAFPWAAAAAAAVLATAASLWLLQPSSDEGDAALRDSPAASSVPGEPGPGAPRVFAVTLSPVAVRSSSEAPPVIPPSGTDILALHLEGDPGSQRLTRGRAVIQTVDGGNVWEGAIGSAAELPAGIVARVDVPAATLPVNDYVLTLFEMDAAGVDQERQRYFLRVRPR
jgi:hypothetical protein